MTLLSRRAALKVLSAGAVTLYLKPGSLLATPPDAGAGASAVKEEWLRSVSPIDRMFQGDVALSRFSGDDFNRPHSILWDKNAYLQQAQRRFGRVEKAPLVIVGGGISGLFTAWLLREHQPIVLEQAPRFGGNSKGESWKGMDYAIGAAYLLEPEPESELFTLVHELGIDKLWRRKEGEDLFEVDGGLQREFWNRPTPLVESEQFFRLESYLRRVNEGVEIPFPEIPVTDRSQLEYIRKLDRISFLEHIENVTQSPLHPWIRTGIEHYCWSSLGGSASEIRGAAGLNFYAAEFGNVAVLPGGNAALAERALVRISETVPAQNLRTGALVFDVRVRGSDVLVSYQDNQGKDKQIAANTVVLACPKFVVGKILHGIEDDRLKAIQRLRYRSYLVANVLLRQTTEETFYDLYLLGAAKEDFTSATTASLRQGVTDIVLGTYARPTTEGAILTLYRALPYDGARAELFHPDAYGRYRKEFEAQIIGAILPMLEVPHSALVDLRIARWGHPLPLAEKGFIADGIPEILTQPFRKRVFFVEQDNWALPAFETAASEAITWSKEIARSLRI